MRVETAVTAWAAEFYETYRSFFSGALLDGEGDAVLHAGAREGGAFVDDLTLVLSGAVRKTRVVTKAQGTPLVEARARKRAVKHALYLLLCDATGKRPPWGSLTGVRPTLLMAERVRMGEDRERASDALTRQFDLSREKAELLFDCMKAQAEAPAPSVRDVDIYAGIPFCPTRCAYCSFASEPVARSGRLVGPYLSALFRELDGVAPAMLEAGYRPRAVYVGGGTPTTLSAEALGELLARLRGYFPSAFEWTVEAGRPDSVDPEKFAALARAGVTRVSINPQSMNDDTLARIGRRHSAADIERAFAQARDAGSFLINMDVIAALPGETIGDVARTLDRIAALAPDNLTVHTLAIKRGSGLREAGHAHAPPAEAEGMVALAARRAAGMGMRPYYLYRQKQMAGGLENVGYALPGTVCAYNIDMMEETCSVAAFGAGGISKRVFDRDKRIERAPNIKPVADYIARVGEMIERKQALFQAEYRGVDGR